MSGGSSDGPRTYCVRSRFGGTRTVTTGGATLDPWVYSAAAALAVLGAGAYHAGLLRASREALPAEQAGEAASPVPSQPA